MNEGHWKYKREAREDNEHLCVKGIDTWSSVCPDSSPVKLCHGAQKQNDIPLLPPEKTESQRCEVTALRPTARWCKCCGISSNLRSSEPKTVRFCFLCLSEADKCPGWSCHRRWGGPSSTQEPSPNSDDHGTLERHTGHTILTVQRPGAGCCVTYR